MPRVKIFGISVNPGPFTLKEHVLATIMSTVNSGSAYAVSTINWLLFQMHLYSYLTPDRYYCRPTRLLQPDLQFHLPMVVGHVYAAGEVVSDGKLNMKDN